MTTSDRVAVLEIQLRFMKRIVFGISAVITLNFVICSLIITGYFVSTTGVPDVIQAKRFEVVNTTGTVLASLYSDADGGVLGIMDKSGQGVACLITVDPGGGGVLGISNNKWMPVVVVHADDGGGVVTVTNKHGQANNLE